MLLQMFFTCDVILSHMHIGHSGPVRGVAVDSLNMDVFSGSGDGTIKVPYSAKFLRGLIFADFVG